MFNKKEITGIIAGTVGGIVGVTIALYTAIQCKREEKEMDGIMGHISDCSKEINELLKQTGLNVLDKIDEAYKNGEFDQDND